MGNSFATAPRGNPPVHQRKMVNPADKKTPFVDWEAALAGIAGGNPFPEYTVNRSLFTKQTESVMTSKRIPINSAAFSNKGSAVAARNKSQPEPITAIQKSQPVDWAAFLAGISRGKTILEYGVGRTIFVQGDPADSVWYLMHGRVKLAVTSQQGKEAIVTVLGDNEFFGEGCLAGQALRISTAIAVSDCTLYRIEKALMVRLLHEQHGISELFVTHLLSRNIRFEGDLVDQLFNSSEKRLARILLLLAHFGKESRSEAIHPGINQEHLAQMVGTTRSRVSHFMNKFRTLGFIDYTGSGALTVNNGLLTVILSD
jgi:CRP/FNR family cyclic AMP-dependent transcriptional regulator